MQIKIFAGEKPVYLTDDLSGKSEELSRRGDAIFINADQTPDAISIIRQLEAENKTAAVILSKNFPVTKAEFFNAFEIIEAAGGVVQNDNKDILFIFRRGKWDLPKGKMEKKESAETCAEREIEEETGANSLTLKKKIGETYHIYQEKGKDILKISHWFYFTCYGRQTLLPQISEDITEAKWLSTRDIKQPMENTYESIRHILRIFFDTP